jgi:hypothetical protein
VETYDYPLNVRRWLIEESQNVVEYETVLANGSIINIKAIEHNDLIRAMRGGGSQFGV